MRRGDSPTYSSSSPGSVIGMDDVKSVRGRNAEKTGNAVRFNEVLDVGIEVEISESIRVICEERFVRGYVFPHWRSRSPIGESIPVSTNVMFHFSISVASISISPVAPSKVKSLVAHSS